MQKIPYIIIVGDEEMTTQTISIRDRTGGSRSSRPEELPLQPLTERYVNLSIHTALVKQTRPLFRMPNEQTTWVYP